MLVVMGRVFCDKKSCVNNKEGYCTLVDPEKVGNSCLEFEDFMDFSRLNADALKGTLG